MKKFALILSLSALATMSLASCGHYRHKKSGEHSYSCSGGPSCGEKACDKKKCDGKSCKDGKVCKLTGKACPHKKGHRKFMMLDANSDGSISMEEWSKKFVDMDGDKNGKVSSEEMHKHHRAMHPKGKGGSCSKGGKGPGKGKAKSGK